MFCSKLWKICKKINSRQTNIYKFLMPDFSRLLTWIYKYLSWNFRIVGCYFPWFFLRTFWTINFIYDVIFKTHLQLVLLKVWLSLNSELGSFWFHLAGYPISHHRWNEKISFSEDRNFLQFRSSGTDGLTFMRILKLSYICLYILYSKRHILRDNDEKFRESNYWILSIRISDLPLIRRLLKFEIKSGMTKMKPVRWKRWNSVSNKIMKECYRYWFS